jgi:hypothetical protein
LPAPRRGFDGTLLGHDATLGSAAVGEVLSPCMLPSAPFFWLIAATYALSILYGLTLKATARHRAPANFNDPPIRARSLG